MLKIPKYTSIIKNKLNSYLFHFSFSKLSFHLSSFLFVPLSCKMYIEIQIINSTIGDEIRKMVQFRPEKKKIDGPIDGCGCSIRRGIN